MAKYVGEIRGMLLPIVGGHILLPNANIAEVITYTDPEQVQDVPAWIYGRIVWRGWSVPVFSFSQMTESSQEEGFLGSKLAVFKALTGNPKMPFIATVSQGIPRVVTLNQETMQKVEKKSLPLGVHSFVSIEGVEAMVPDLDIIEPELVPALINPIMAI
ncbi:MAG: chemotaxis protein CheW [bacterium]